MVIELLQLVVLIYIAYNFAPKEQKSKVRKIVRKKPSVYLPEEKQNIDDIIKEYEVS